MKKILNPTYLFYIFLTDVKRSIELLDKLQKSKPLTITRFYKINNLSFEYLIQSKSVFLEGGEIPVTKLAALQKVLQSDFLNAIREVYEHIYDTVDVQVTYYIFSLHFYSLK